MSHIHTIGIMAEDDSDFIALRELIKRIAQVDNLSFKKKVSGGCGRLKKKCLDWSNELYALGCELVILAHDRDKNDEGSLRKELEDKLKNSLSEKRFICIPVEELEAWYLSDPDGIKKVFNLKTLPRFPGMPEDIPSPKEKLRDQVSRCSANKRLYLNTRHNETLAKNLSIDHMKDRCPSFNEFHTFLKTHRYR